MANKQQINITISGDVDTEHKQFLTVMLNEFLEFSGFEVDTTFNDPPSDDFLVSVIEDFDDKLSSLNEIGKINISV